MCILEKRLVAYITSSVNAKVSAVHDPEPPHV